MAVTFTNQNTIGTATACLDVSLYVDGISIAVATRRVEYSITAPQSGTDGSGQVTQGNLAGVEANAQTTQINAETGTHTLTFNPTIVGSALIHYGETFDVELDATTGYDIDVSAISVGIITDEKNGVGYVSAPTKKSITIKLPLSSFMDSKGGTETIDLTVDWKLSGTRRQLRGEAESTTTQERKPDKGFPEQTGPFWNVISGHDDFIQGSTHTQMMVQLIPLEGMRGRDGNSRDPIKGMHGGEDSNESCAFLVQWSIGATAATAISLGALFHYFPSLLFRRINMLLHMWSTGLVKTVWESTSRYKLVSSIHRIDSHKDLNLFLFVCKMFNRQCSCHIC